VCHGDPHVGYFDVPELPSRVEGRTDCARCHVTTSFRAFPETFEHRRWTGFALDGQHGRIGCSECHAPLFPPDEFGRTWQAALGTSCASCHADPHGGQFQVDGVQQDCAKCHRAGDAFAELRFDHDRDSRFALGDAHAGIECTQCHPLFQVGETELVRYRPLPSECVDCHGVHEDVLLRRKVRKR
jgi:hypothetical protein